MWLLLATAAATTTRCWRWPRRPRAAVRNQGADLQCAAPLVFQIAPVPSRWFVHGQDWRRRDRPGRRRRVQRPCRARDVQQRCRRDRPAGPDRQSAQLDRRPRPRHHHPAIRAARRGQCPVPPIPRSAIRADRRSSPTRRAGTAGGPAQPAAAERGGGATRKWKIDNSELDRAIEHLQASGERDGGSVIAVTSPRTSARTRRLLDEGLTGSRNAVVDDLPRFPALLSRCDEIYVTADSVSMLAEAILTGKPVAMIPIARTWKGTLGHWIHRMGFPIMPTSRNLSKYTREQ